MQNVINSIKISLRLHSNQLAALERLVAEQSPKYLEYKEDYDNELEWHKLRVEEYTKALKILAHPWTSATQPPLIVEEFTNAINILEQTPQDMQDVCDLCCDAPTVDINNGYIGEIFQWLEDNDYIIYKKV